MKTRFKALASAAVAAILVFSLSSAVSAATTVYDVTKDFSRAVPQGAGAVWHYQTNDGSGFKDLPVFFADWDAWVLLDDPSPGPYATVGMAGGVFYLHPDSNKETGAAIDSAVVWTAPADGTVTIPAVTVAHQGNNDPDTAKGTQVWIEFKGTKYNETKLDFDGSADLAAVTLNVKQGEKVLFVSNNNGRGGNNTTYWPITVSFDSADGVTNDGAAPADDGAIANPATGDAGVTAYVIAAAIALAGIVLLMARKRRTSN